MKVSEAKLQRVTEGANQFVVPLFQGKYSGRHNAYAVGISQNRPINQFVKRILILATFLVLRTVTCEAGPGWTLYECVQQYGEPAKGSVYNALEGDFYGFEVNNYAICVDPLRRKVSVV
jgi:hypothetical protein